MKKLLIILLTLAISESAFSQLDSAYSKFLIFKSQAIDYYPVWGETDDIIYINIMSKEWRKYDLSKTKIMDGTYYEHDLAINTAENYTIESNKKITSDLETNKDWKPREITDSNNNVIKVYQEGYSAALSINDEKIMNIKGNAHSLAISPTGKYVACLFELTGLMIFDIQKELKDINEKNEKLAKMTNLEKAEYYLKNRDMKSFESSLNHFTDEEKKTIDYHYYLGLINYLKSEQDPSLSEIAISHLNKACDDSRFYDSNVLLSSLYQNKGDWENSLKYADKAIELTPEHPSGYTMKGDYFENKGESEKACEYYQKAFDKGDQWAQMKLMKCK